MPPIRILAGLILTVCTHASEPPRLSLESILTVCCKGAPETFRCSDVERIPLRVGRQVDLWSLGCVFSEVAVWIGGGISMVKEYRRLRQEEAAKSLPSGIGEVFHDGQMALNIVGRSHTNVVRSRRRDDFITERVLWGPVAVMLQEKAEDRKEVQRLLGQTDEIVRSAEADLQKDADRVRNEAHPVESAAPKPIISSGVNAIGNQPEPTLYEPPNHIDAQPSKLPGDPSKLPQRDPSIAQRKKVPYLSMADALSRVRSRKRFHKARFLNEELLNDLKDMDHVGDCFDSALIVNEARSSLLTTRQPWPHTDLRWKEF